MNINVVIVVASYNSVATLTFMEIFVFYLSKSNCCLSDQLSIFFNTEQLK